MSDDETLIDRIYEAAFVPEQWQAVLDDLSARSGSAAGQLMVFNDIVPMQFRATDLTTPVMEEFRRGAWRDSGERITYFFRQPCYGFVLAHEYYPHEVREDASRRLMLEKGFDSQLGTLIPMPSGDLAVFAFERWRDLGVHEASAISYMNTVYPHLARAALVASRLGLERAQSAVSTLEALGVPAAAMTRTGKVMAVNELFATVGETILPIAFGGLAIASAPANKLFQEAIAHALTSTDGAVRSIPVPARDDQPPRIVHVLPLFRDARDTLFGAEILVAITNMRPGNLVPSSPILMGLFDLTPSEARLAMALASGKSLRQAASEMGLSFGSARTYLAHIFAKTGTNQQSQLVSLLKSSQPIMLPEPSVD
ncbi:DNA-binding CsgD family transcriptional regulator [Mesorhizobium sp. J18]|jgi:DNA-binding CsgD family transcriptional regulator|uniref:helix-turn-helix transcriptional regulator n=1 Tax=Mesorhizobium sp. J18 TaxID=935263 RepID=UPI001199A4B4|nr:helix-turn-helix transcriptional regulator [Mesorhizobium sp. J18]TWG94700.1 DNA-binding CsgD family transcriptional regulator [Mesorhizobium sp. J18]